MSTGECFMLGGSLGLIATMILLWWSGKDGAR
jgi:hypothetical protein